MPNDLTAEQNVLSRGADVHLALFQHIDSKGFFPRGGGGVAFIWTLAGLVLTAWFALILPRGIKGH